LETFTFLSRHWPEWFFESLPFFVEAEFLFVCFLLLEVTAGLTVFFEFVRDFAAESWALAC